MTKESPCRFDLNAVQQVFHHNESRTIVIVMIMLLFSCALCSTLTVALLPTENKEKSFNHATQWLKVEFFLKKPNIKHSSWGILLRTKLKFACKLLNIILVCVFSYKFTCCRQLFSIPIFPSFYDSSSLANLCKSDRSPIKMIFKLLKSLSQIIERLCSF